MDRKIRRNKLSYTICDIYRTYEDADNVNYSRFKRILDTFNRIILESVLNRAEGFKMPCGLGYICICKYRPKSYTDKSLSVDYKASKEEGKRIFHLNEHSNGYKYRLYWSKTPRTFPARYKYRLMLVRDNKRYLAQLIFNKTDYINIDDIQIYKM